MYLMPLRKRNHTIEPATMTAAFLPAPPLHLKACRLRLIAVLILFFVAFLPPLPKVFSFDLVSPNPLVTACDMAHVPLKDGSVHLAIFCLSLMGTNLADFLREAHRVLVTGGLIKVGWAGLISSAAPFVSVDCLFPLWASGRQEAPEPFSV